MLCVPLAPLLRILPEFGAVIVIELSFLCPVLLQKRCKSTKPNLQNISIINPDRKLICAKKKKRRFQFREIQE